MLQPHRNKKFLMLKRLLSQLKNMPAPLMTFRLLKKMLVPRLMTPFQPLKKLAGHPLVVCLKKLKKSGQLHQLRLKKLNQIPQPEEPEIAIPEVVMQLTDTPVPKPMDPFSKRQKFKAEDFFSEHVFFTDYNSYDSARRRGVSGLLVKPISIPQ